MIFTIYPTIDLPQHMHLIKLNKVLIKVSVSAYDIHPPELVMLGDNGMRDILDMHVVV